MTVFGRAITDEDMRNIASYMDDEIREWIHSIFSPCSNEDFIKLYVMLNPDFEYLLKCEFNWRA